MIDAYAGGFLLLAVDKNIVYIWQCLFINIYDAIITINEFSFLFLNNDIICGFCLYSHFHLDLCTYVICVNA